MLRRFLTVLVLCALPVVADPTCVVGPLYKADNSLYTGSLYVSWPNFTAGDGKIVAAGSLRVPVTAGAFKVCLQPNDAASPSGTSYNVRYSLTDGMPLIEYWIVPTSGSPVSIGTVRTTTVPTPSLVIAPTQISAGGATLSQVLQFNGASWVPGDALVSVFGRTGAVDAEAGDYTAAQITNTPAGNIAATTVQDALNELDTEKASTSHDHASTYAPINKGVTNGDSHDHSGGDGAQIAYSSLSGLPSLDFAPSSHDHSGVYEPADAGIQAHLSATDNPHIVTATQVGFTNKTTLDKITESGGVPLWNGGTWPGAGSGDVVGPAKAEDSNFAAFDSTTGKLLKDSGYNASSFAEASHDHDGDYEPADAGIQSHISATGNPHGATLADIEIGDFPPSKVAGLPINGLLALYDFIPGVDRTVLYDRSGKGNHGTLGTGGAAPQWLKQGLQFTGTAGTYVALPASAGVSGNASFTVIAIGRTGQATSYSGAVQTLWSWGGSGVRKVPSMVLTGLNPPKSEVRAGGGDNLAANFISGFDPHVYTVRYDSANLSMTVNVDKTSTYSNSKQLGGTPNWDLTNGIYLGVLGAVKSSPLTGALYGLAIYDRVLTDDEVDSAVSIMRTWGTMNPVVVFDGASHTAGAPLYETTTYPYQAMAGQGFEWYNFGVYGQTSANMIADFDTQILPLAKAGRRQILVVSGTGNDLLTMTPQEMVESYARYCTLGRLAGYYVIAQTIFPRPDSALFTTTTRAAANNLIRSNWANFADALVDVGADPILGCDACIDDESIYVSDRTHFTPEGYMRYASLVQPAILAVPELTAQSGAAAASHEHSALDVTSGILPLARGGTGAATWVAGRCVRVNDAGTALEVAAADCGTGGGSGSGTVNSGTAGQIAYYASDGTAVSGNTTLTVDANGFLTQGIGYTAGHAQTLGNAGDTGPSSLTIHAGDAENEPAYLRLLTQSGHDAWLYACGHSDGRLCVLGSQPGAVATNPVVTTDSTDTLSNKTLDNSNKFSGFVDLATVAAPANPASGGRVWLDSGTGKLVCKDATGADCMPSSGGGGSSVGAVQFVLDGGGSAITTGAKGWITIPYAGTITGWELTADQEGSITIDLWKDSFANFPPTVADTIFGTKPALSTEQTNSASGLSIAVSAGDYIRLNVDSAATVQYVVLALKISKS